MRAVQVREFGGPDVLVPVELPDPTPGPGQVTIEVTHASVGLIDVFLRQGMRADVPGLPQPPYIPGLEVAGTVREVGEGVTGLRVGEPVVTLSGNNAGAGGYASVYACDARYVASMDGFDVDPALAVTTVPNAATAYLALTQAAAMRPGARVLVHGMLGGLASGFPGMARELGASRVVGSVRSADLRAASSSKLPYDQIVDSGELATTLAEERFDVIVDPVGGAVRTSSLALLAPMGTMLLVGNASEDWAHTLPSNLIWQSNAGVRGFNVGAFLPANLELAPAAAQAAVRVVAAGLAQTGLEKMPLEDAAEAHRRLEAREVGGRLVLVL